MLTFTMYENSGLVIHNGTKYPVSDSDIDAIFCHTAKLIDERQYGVAVITLGDATVTMDEQDWVTLYDGVEAYELRAFGEEEEPTILH